MEFPRTLVRSLGLWMDASSAFLRTWIRSPRTVGMICPSGPPLARCMASYAPRDGLVVELGAGTGTVTRRLLDAGVSPCNLIALDQSPDMADLLRSRFPRITVMEADARSLTGLLPEGRKADCIVSSLPLLSLNRLVRIQIVHAMTGALREGGLLIQYTYSWRRANAFLTEGFHCIGSRQVWGNVPPARVFLFRRAGNPAA